MGHDAGVLAGAAVDEAGATPGGGDEGGTVAVVALT